MSCCKDPYLMEESESFCECVFQACFNCNDWTMISWCKLHNPEGGE